jgi:hypothetical protein
MFNAILLHAAHAPHVHGGDPIVLIAIVSMLVSAAACLIGMRVWR